MDISKSLFLNLIRCHNFAPLWEIRQKKEKAIINIDSLIDYEKSQKIDEILEHMFDEDDNFILQKENLQVKTLQDEYAKVERFANSIVNNKFKSRIESKSIDTKQYRAFANYDGYNFYAFLDILKETDDEINVFEVKATTTSKLYKLKNAVLDDNAILKILLNENTKLKFSDPFGDFRYFYDLAFQRFVLERSDEFNPNKKKINYYIALLNSEYIYDGAQKDGKNYYDDSLIRFIDANEISEYIIKTRFQYDLENVINYLNNENFSNPKISKTCFYKKARECPFLKLCFKENNIPDKNSLYTFSQYHQGFTDKLGEKVSFFEALNSKRYKLITDCTDLLESDKNYYLKRKIQIDCLLNNKKFIQKDLIFGFIKNLKYPIYHLDFETLPVPIPRFWGEKPYTQSVFQFSVHIERKPGVCDKKNDNVSFLFNSPTVDQREELIIKLLDTIKDDGGSVIAYNMSFEKARLKELAEIFPKYSQRLLDVIDRVVDLMDVFSGYRMKDIKDKFNLTNSNPDLYPYYDSNFQGKTSIKITYPVLVKNNAYTTMPIHNGVMALTEFFISPTYKDKELEKYRKNAIEYCMQDTYSMFEILKFLRGI